MRTHTYVLRYIFFVIEVTSDVSITLTISVKRAECRCFQRSVSDNDLGSLRTPLRIEEVANETIKTLSCFRKSFNEKF